MGNRSKRDARMLDTATRDREIMELRKAGLTNDVIARRFGLCEGAVRKAIKRILAEANLLAGKARDEFIKSELESIERDEQRAERMIAKRLRHSAERGEDPEAPFLSDKDAKVVLGAMESKRKCREERAKYLQLYAPEKVEHSGPDGGPMQFAPVIMIPPERDDDGGSSGPSAGEEAAAPAGLGAESGPAD